MPPISHEDADLCAVSQIQAAEGLSYAEALARIQQRDAALIAQYGWVAHAITTLPLIHTHGLPENFWHPDLEIRLAVSSQTRYDLLAVLVNAVKSGRRFVAGQEDTTVFFVPIRFIAREESGRVVLRALFPDPDGHFPGDPGCPPEWADQLIQD